MNGLTAPFNPLANLARDDEFGIDIVRNAVREIVGSYHHPFDIFLEGLQNAVDACEVQFVRDGEDYAPQVHVIVDLDDNVVEISDNGCGISAADIERFFFTPFASPKRTANEAERAVTRGNKGVGATFLSYGSQRFEIWSVAADTGEQSAGALVNAASWLSTGEGASPEVIPNDVSLCGALEPHGTAVRFKVNAEHSRIGSLREQGTTTAHWSALLRLYTAAGYIDLEDAKTFLQRLRIRLTVLHDGVRDSQFVDGGFLYPHTLTASHVEMTQLVYSGPRNELDVRQRDKDVLYSSYAPEKVAEIINQVVTAPYYRENKRRAMRKILTDHRPRAYVAFTHSAEFWDVQNDKVWGENSERYLTHGYLYSTKNQRIGEQNRLTLTTRTGDFNRFLMVLELDDLAADIGRKSIGAEFEAFANELLRGVRKSFYDHRAALKPSPSSFSEDDAATLEEVRDKAFNRPALGLAGLHLVRVPDSEQDVVALFFDMLGLGLLKGYQMYATHTAQTYDGVGFFELAARVEHFYDSTANRLGVPRDKFSDGFRKSETRAFFEFKHSSDGLIRDLESGAKRLSDIKWLVCWDLGTRHVDYGAAIHEILEPAYINQRDYYGVTHVLTEGAAKVHVICLKSVLQYLQTRNESGS